MIGIYCELLFFAHSPAAIVFDILPYIHGTIAGYPRDIWLLLQLAFAFALDMNGITLFASPHVFLRLVSTIRAAYGYIPLDSVLVIPYAVH